MLSRYYEPVRSLNIFILLCGDVHSWVEGRWWTSHSPWEVVHTWFNLQASEEHCGCLRLRSANPSLVCPIFPQWTSDAKGQPNYSKKRVVLKLMTHKRYRNDFPFHLKQFAILSGLLFHELHIARLKHGMLVFLALHRNEIRCFVEKSRHHCMCLNGLSNSWMFCRIAPSYAHKLESFRPLLLPGYTGLSF